MNAHIGNGWRITHLTDHCLDLVKDSYEYRKFSGQDGFVRVRGEKGMDRNTLIERGLKHANRCDAELAKRVAAESLPTGKAWAEYRNTVRSMAKANQTGEEPFLIGVKRV